MGGEQRATRLSTNAVNVLITCVFLFFAVQFTDGGGGFATRITKIMANLDKAVSNLESNISYSDYIDTSVYNSSTQFYARGMDGLYNLTNMFIDLIVPEDILMPDLILIDSRNNVRINENPDLMEVFNYYRKLVALLVFLVLCIILYPLCGLCFCCCRCCGNCGARSQPADKKKDTCKKIMQGTLLIVFGTGLLFCVVCAFGSNQQLQDGLDDYAGDLKLNVKDTDTFLDTTNKQVRYLLKNNYDEFEDAFLKTIDSSSVIVTEQLYDYSNATAMTALYNFTLNLETINLTLQSLKTNSNRLRVYASQLNDAVRKVKGDLLNTLKNCEAIGPECWEITNNISKLETNIDFNSLPDVTSDLEFLNGKLKIDEIKAAALKGYKSLEDVKQHISDALDKGLTDAKRRIVDTSQTITDNLESVTNTIDNLRKQIDSSASPAIRKVDDYISEYGKYRYYVGLAISCILLLVTICIALGLICGVCGKRPDGYSDNCCNKGAGSQFLLCAVMIMFFFGFVISVVSVVGIIAGVFSEKAICDPLQDPNPAKYRIIKILDSFDSQLDVEVKMSEILNRCYQNQSVYNTFNLENKFNLEKIISQFDISAELNKLNIDDKIFVDFKILDEGGYNTLNELLNFKPSDLSGFSEELSDEFTNYSLTDISEKLEDIISQLQKTDKYEEVKASLQLSVLHLNTYNEKLLVPMKSLAKTVMDDANQLQEYLKMNRNTFTEAITDLIEETKSAEKYLKFEGPEELKNITNEFKTIIDGQIQSFIDRVSDHIENKIGLCGPLNLVVHALLTSTCSKVLLPWNGFWFSLLCTAILYVVVIIISIKLANLYQKYKPYGPYVETRGGKRGKKKGKKSKRYEDRSAVGSEVAREYAAGSRPPDGRYADMAPKFPFKYPVSNPKNPYASSEQNYLKSTRF